MNNRSYFEGNVVEYILISIGIWLINLITLGIAFPWTYVYLMQWMSKNSVVDGNRLVFEGKGLDLFVLYIKWIFFCIITLGFYLFILPVRLKQWELKNTHIQEIVA